MEQKHEEEIMNLEGKIMNYKMKEQSNKADHLEEKHNFNQVMQDQREKQITAEAQVRIS